MQIQGNIGDFIEEERAAVTELEAPDAIGARVRESAFDVAEELAFENSLRKTAGVDRYHRLRVAARKRVERLCNNLLPGAVLASNEHVCVGRADARDELQHGLHRGGFRDEIRPRFGAQ